MRISPSLSQQQLQQCAALPVNEVAHDLHTHIAAVFDLADAAAATAGSSGSGSGSSSGFLAPLTDTLETVLKTIQAQLTRFNVPYSYGYSIILLTVIVKMVTLPLTKIQVCVCVCVWYAQATCLFCVCGTSTLTPTFVQV